jgi:hypothetical protein
MLTFKGNDHNVALPGESIRQIHSKALKVTSRDIRKLSLRSHPSTLRTAAPISALTLNVRGMKN